MRRAVIKHVEEVLDGQPIRRHSFKHVEFLGSCPMTDSSTKSQRTRERIYGCAMDLLMSHGYEKTTMRMIADRAGVNVALSYYYFPSKEHLVAEFYRNFSRDFIERSAAVVEGNSKLEARLIGVAETMFAAAQPYHAFAGSLFATAASPTSPLNPFSADCADIRSHGIALCARVIDGCAPRVPKDVAEELPFLLWVFNLGMLYCWMHDHSEHQQKTRTILRKSARLVAGLIRLSSSPGARQLLRQMLSITHLVRSNLPDSRESAA
jgi:AcrR family transcriptional regulator